MQTSVVDIHKKKGIRPAFDVYIGRATQYTEFTEDSKWCNPFGRWIPLNIYENYIRSCIEKNPLMYNLSELTGKKLGCWCITTSELIPLQCHGQVLLKLIREAGLV